MIHIFDIFGVVYQLYIKLYGGFEKMARNSMFPGHFY